MQKRNIREIAAEEWSSPKGKYVSCDQELSVALGHDPGSNDLRKRHPFDVEICQIPPGKTPCPYHSHSAQWEFYHVMSGHGVVRHEEGETPVAEGDFFIFGPGEAHQIMNSGTIPLVIHIVADNPTGESCYYPDSKKWMVRSPRKQLIRSEALDYLDGEE